MLTEKELSDFSWQREHLIKTIKDCVPAGETRDDLGRIAARREELESIVNGTAEEPVLLHPNMAGYYRQQVSALAEALNDDENRAEAADIIRSLVDRITLRVRPTSC